MRAINPATGQPLEPPYYSLNEAQVDEAAKAAAAAFPKLRQKTAKERAHFLRAAATRIESSAEDIVPRAMLETGLPEARLRMELGRTCGQLRLFASVIEEGSWVRARIDHAQPKRKPMPMPDVRSMLQPMGPVAVFCASNFPLAFSVAGGDTASAFAAGCPVIVKAHHSHPGTAEFVGRCVLGAAMEAGMPPGTFALLHGEGRVTGAALVRHPAIRAVGFTGSHAGGRALMDIAAARPEPIPVYAEMGSLNPVFVLPEAMASRWEEIAQGLSASVNLGVGQFCTCPGLAFVERTGILKQFNDKLAELQKAAPPAVMLNPTIHEAYQDGLIALKERSGVEQLAGQDDLKDCKAAPACFFASAETFLADAELSQEIFGPTTTVVSWAGKKQLCELARRLQGHLTATIHGTEKDLAEHAELLEILERKVGRIVFNGFPTGVEVCQAMVHGGPYPATSDGASTSVGTAAILRFARPVCYQGFPQSGLPPALKEENPLGIWRLVDGEYTR